MSRRSRLVAAIVAAVAVLVVVLVLVTASGPGTRTITADFAETPGLYPGNRVDILGLSVGNVVSVKPEAGFVAVKMTVDRSVSIPADVDAYLMAPNVVNDRYVQLDPAYRSGPTLPDGSVIPLSRTATPVTVDQIIGSLDSLAKALGPTGANANGALTRLLHSAAVEFAGQGSSIHQTITDFGQALSALSTDSSDVTALIDNMGTVTTAAANASASYKTFASQLAAVSTMLNGDSASITSALSSLDQALAAVAQFVKTNASNLGSSVANLQTLAGAIAAQQQQLAGLLSSTPLALENLSAAYDPNPAGGGGPALRSRLDLVPGSSTLVNQVCGNSVLRLLVVAVDQSNDPIPTTDLACGVAAGLEALPLPPGGSGPNMTLSSLLGAGK